jgi:hypothetical protein
MTRVLADLRHDSRAPAKLRESRALDAPKPVQGKRIFEDEEQLREVPALVKAGVFRPLSPALLLRPI